jgi:Secretion system C-terminal sorting domain
VPNKIYFHANSNFPLLDQTWTITKLSPATTPPVILHQNNPVYVFNDTGFYRVCLRAITLGGCVKEFCQVIRIERVVNSVCELQAFPNPASNLINVTILLAQPGMIDAYVYNTMNVQVREKHQQGVSGNNLVSINVNDLVAGLYTIKVKYGDRVCYARFNKL